MPQTWGVDHHQIRDVSHTGDLVVLAQSHNPSEHDHLMILDRRAGNKLRLITPKQDSHHVYGGRLTRDEAALVFVAGHDYDTGATVEGATVEGAIVWLEDIHACARRRLAETRNFFDRAPSLSPSGDHVLLQVNERPPGGRICGWWGWMARGCARW